MEDNYKFNILAKTIISRFANISFNLKKYLSLRAENIIRRFTKTREQEIHSLMAINSRLENENTILHEKLSVLRSNNFKMIAQKDSWERVSLGDVAGMLNWPKLLIDSERTNGFSELIRLLSLFSNEESFVNSPSCCWVLLSTKNCDQLLESGYHNFKRTIGHNYFNFLVQEGDPQIHATESLLSAETREACQQIALSIPNDPTFDTAKQFSYHYFILLLWEYVKKIDNHHYLDKLAEPMEGNPILVTNNGKSMSQDLANSIIEYYSINEHLPFQQVSTVLEIGSGYGRNAHVILSLNPKAKIVLVDILPALYIAQRYLSSVFKNHKIFRAKAFSSYEEVKNEMEAASIVFLLPHQLALMPDKHFDLSMNISSLAEMNMDQIKWYFTQINRLTRKCFYTKQWDISKNPFDDLELKKNDYPYPENWQPIYSRNCAIQNEFHETLYAVTTP